MMRMSAIKLLILGHHKVGKSALTVRFLTKRFIGEYDSYTDHVYRASVRLEDSAVDVELVDTCSKTTASELDNTQVTWCDAVVIVFSVCCRHSFQYATQLFLHLAHTRSTYLPILLLGNKRDLDHRREVTREEAEEVAMEHGCQYFEVSAAENAANVSSAFQIFLREVGSVQQRCAALLKKRRGSFGSVSKILGAVFGKTGLGGSKDGQSDKRFPKDIQNEKRLSKDSQSDKRMTKDFQRERKLSLSPKSKERFPERRFSLSIGSKTCHSERRLSLSDKGKEGHGEWRMTLSNAFTQPDHRLAVTSEVRHCEERRHSGSDSTARNMSPCNGQTHDDHRAAVSCNDCKDGHSERQVSLLHECKDCESQRRLSSGS